jgi:hypothetical protein
MTKKNNHFEQQWEEHRDRILTSTLHSLNEATIRERNRKLSQFSTSELEQELLKRQKCQFNRLTCTKQPVAWMVKSQDPACFNCQQDILSLQK